jgi:7-cyano-7-deazaguanine synthase
MKKCLVVLSGGQDSVTCLFWAKQRFDEVHAVSFDYGQRHAIELDSAEKTAFMAGVKSHEIISVPNCLVSASPLTSSNELEKYANAKQMEEVIGNRVELTFVPARNTLFLTVAMNRAVALNCRDLVTGICQEDNANYPDCRESYRASLERSFNLSLGIEDFLIHAPLMFLSKAESVRLAHELPGCWAALAYSHTSYDGKYPPTDNNHSNVLRAHGFEVAGLPDPLVLRANKEGLMDLPSTANYDNFRSELHQ